MNAPRAARRDVDGVLLLDKPLGLTSQQAVSCVKRLFLARKAGHTGTLDPMAGGLLPVGLGEATKFSQFLLDADKGYLATVRLGVTTETGDAEGRVVERRPVMTVAADVGSVLKHFVGEQRQTPPMYSALKLAGKPLYTYARAGVNVEREARIILVKSIQLVDFKEELIVIRVLCSKGTYIRVLAEDIGRALGCGAHLAALTRESAGGFTLPQAVSCDALETMSLEDRMAQLLPVDTFASSLDRMLLDPEGERRIVTGQGLRLEDAEPGLCRLYGSGDAFLGVGEVKDGVLVARRLTSRQSGSAKRENSLSNPSVTG